MFCCGLRVVSMALPFSFTSAVTARARSPPAEIVGVAVPEQSGGLGLGLQGLVALLEGAPNWSGADLSDVMTKSDGRGTLVGYMAAYPAATRSTSAVGDSRHSDQVKG